MAAEVASLILLQKSCKQAGKEEFSTLFILEIGHGLKHGLTAILYMCTNACILNVKKD